MRTRVFEQQIIVDLIPTVIDLGELSKLGAVLGYNVHIEAPYDDEVTGHQVRLEYPPDRIEWTSSALADLAMISALTQKKSGTQILQELDRAMRRWHFPMDRPIEDVMEIGGGSQHDGHEDE